MLGHLGKVLTIAPTGETVARACIEGLLSAEVGDLDMKGIGTALVGSFLLLNSSLLLA